MANRSRKSSACVTLVLIGAAAVAGCDDSPDAAARRKQYPTKEACVADWGDPDDCAEQVAQERDGTRRRYYSYGGSGTGTYHGSDSANRSVTRGGFGASGHAHSAGS